MLRKISFIGAGSMTEAILSGVIKKEFVQSDQIFITNRNNQERLEFLKKNYHIQGTQDKSEVIQDADIIILSMKPADIKAAIDSIKPFLNPNQLVISVAAGVSIDFISKAIGENKQIPIIRVMPNTSALVGRSATAITKGRNATEEHLELSEDLFNTIGTTAFVDEKDMHTVTGISGSGPAYIYLLVEAMEQAAIETGLDPHVAKSLITQTVVGAGEMLQQSGITAQELRKNVTSPSGTTEAGIETLMKNGFDQAIIECVKNARSRSIELGKEL